jgi:hypothetical protein
MSVHFDFRRLSCRALQATGSQAAISRIALQPSMFRLATAPPSSED